MCLIICIVQIIQRKFWALWLEIRESIHGLFLHADTMGVGTKRPLIILIVRDNIFPFEEEFKNTEILVHTVCLK